MTEHKSLKISTETPGELNAYLNLYGADGKIQFDKDKEATRQYFLQDVNPATYWAHSLEERLRFLVDNDYYDSEVLDQYSFDFIKRLHKRAFSYKFRFETYVGALKFYQQYALKTRGGKQFLERFENRVVMVALGLADGDENLAEHYVDEIISGRYQPATPTFLNLGKKARGEGVSCFPAGSKVVVENGLTKNIEDVRIGDRVLTHTGSMQRVYKTIINPNDRNMITLKANGLSAVTMTSNHPVLIWNDDPEDDRVSLTNDQIPGEFYKWIEAGDVRVNEDFILSPASDSTGQYPTHLYMEDYIEKLPARSEYNNPTKLKREQYEVHEGYVKYRNVDKKNTKKNGSPFSRVRKPVKNEIEIGYDFGRFLGYYLSEGYVASRHKDNVHNAVVFTFGRYEKAYIEDVVELSESLFGITPTINVNENDNSAKIGINNVLVGEMVYALMGTGFGVKSLNETLFNGSDEFVRGLLVGAFRGDGCTFQSKMIMDLVNPELVRQLRLLALRIGLLPQIRDYKNQKGNITTSLSIDAQDPNNYDFIMEVGKNLTRFVEPARPHRYTKFTDASGNGLYLVVGKSESDPVETVYNLEVEEDHTYVVEGYAVHNCFLISANDSMTSITKIISAALQLSKRGGGVGINLSNLRETGAPIKGNDGLASGVVPVMKILEDSFSYADQLGQRQGAGVVSLHVHHPDIMKFLDTKRENADEKIRIKTLSLGVIIPDITFELAKKNEDMYLFSPYDVERIYGVPYSEVYINEKYYEMVDNPEIRKTKISARQLFKTLAEIQFESGYPYVMFEDNVNSVHNIYGKVQFSNLCQEITQVTTHAEYDAHTGETITEGRDISCNLGSLNIAKVMDGGDVGKTVTTAIYALTSVSDQSDIAIVPSVQNGNKKSHAIGLGFMNIHGFLARERIRYGSPEAIEFVHAFASTVRYYATRASAAIADERGETFYEFEKSKYATGEAFEKYVTNSYAPKSQTVRDLLSKFNFEVPTQEQWRELSEYVQDVGLYNAYLMATPPTGSISYVNNSTSSFHPITSKIEVRKEGKLGRVYYPAPFMTNDNLEYYEDAYEIGYEKLIDMYAAAQDHIDQGMSLTLFFKDTHTTRDLNKAQIYAWRKGIKNLYYIRLRQIAIEDASNSECVSCMV